MNCVHVPEDLLNELTEASKDSHQKRKFEKDICEKQISSLNGQLLAKENELENLRDQIKILEIRIKNISKYKEEKD